MRKASLAVFVVLLASSLTSSPVLAKGHEAQDNGQFRNPNSEVTDTVTWWCTNLNDLWHVDVPVVTGFGTLIPPDPSPIPDPCSTPFPIVVPMGSPFMPGGTFIWVTNKTYPPAIRAALTAQGYDFWSDSPAEDFKRKMSLVRVEVWTLDRSALVAEYSFDPQRNFRLVRMQEVYGKLPSDPIVDPALGLDISAEAAGRLPTFGFPVIAGPLPSGTDTGMHWADVYWTLSAIHNDGLGLEDGNFFPAGESYYGGNRFMVGP